MGHPLLKNHPAFQATARRFNSPILFATLIMSASSILALGFPIALKNMVEQYTAENNFLDWALAGMVMLVLSLGLRAYGGLRSTMVAERLKAALRLHLYQKLLKKHMAFHREHGPGDLMSALYSDVDQLSSLYSNLLPSGISSALILIGATIALGRLDAELALVLLLSAGVVFIMLRLAFRRIRKMGKKLHQRISQVYKAVNETFRQVMIIKTYSLSDWAGKRLKREQDEIVELNVKLRFHYGLMSIFTQALLTIALLGGWVLLTRSTAPESLGTQLSALLYGLLLVRQVGNAAGLVAQYRQAQGAMDRLDELLETAEPSQVMSATQLTTFSKLQIQGLEFFYGDKQVLHQLNVELHKGQKVAIVGPNGAGKTTLLNLLIGLETPSQGMLFWNDTDMATVESESLLQRIAFLPQDSLLNQASIAENIRMGHLAANEEELWHAAELAGISDVIHKLKDGMDTLLGSEGSRLSGGEKRRLALARLLIRKDAELYLLDEPTEGLDPEGEQEILTTALEALEEKTVILITHRPAVLERVDRVWTMKNGKLEET